MSRPSPTAVTQSPKWDALLAAIVVVLLLQVWRIQGLAKGVPLFGAPILATAAAVALFAFDRDPRRRVGRFSQPVIRVTVGIVIMVVLSIPTSLHPALSASFLLKDYLRSVILMLLIAWSVRGLVDVRRLAWVQMVGVALCALAIVTHSATGEGRLSTEQTYYDENDLATLIVCTLPLVLYLWRRPTALFGRAVLAGITLFLMTTLGRTGSRGGFLGFLMVALYLLLRFSTISTAKRVGAVAVLSILLVSLASDQYFARIETILHPSKDYNWSGKSETGRMEIWKRGVGYMMDNPIVGVGANAFPKADGTLSPEAQERMRYGRGFKWSTAHNSFLQIGAELGTDLKKRIVRRGPLESSAVAHPLLRFGREGAVRLGEGIGAYTDDRIVHHIAHAALPDLHPSGLGLAAPVVVFGRMQDGLDAGEVLIAGERDE